MRTDSVWAIGHLTSNSLKGHCKSRQAVQLVVHSGNAGVQVKLPTSINFGERRRENEGRRRSYMHPKFPVAL
jgi:hypothetical protein